MLNRMDELLIAQAASGVTCQIFSYDNVILFYPILPCIEDVLKYTEKSLEVNKRTFLREIRYRKVDAYTAITRNNKQVGVTYQGFLNRIIQALLKANVSWNVCDMRVSNDKLDHFPKPRLDLMYGFRFSQEELLTKYLTSNMSGLIGAPTRWGKSTLITNTVRAYPTLPTVVTAPGVDLVHQLYDDLTHPTRGIKGREIKLICSGSRTRFPSDEGVTVCSADSLSKCNFGGTQLLLADEPHALVTDSRLPFIDKFTHARRLGFGATLNGRFDGRDMLIEGVFGPVICERTYLEGVAEGAICPIHVIWVEVELSPANYRCRDKAYEKTLFKSPQMCAITRSLCEQVIPADWQTLIFIKDETQANMMLDHIGREHTVAMAKLMNKKERQDIAARMKSNEIKRCLCTKIYVQGVTFSDVRVLINAEAGGNNTSAIQKPGRLAEIRPNKKCGVVIDFMFKPPAYINPEDHKQEPWLAPAADSRARWKAYHDKGYEQHEARTIEEVDQIFKSIAI